MALVSLDMVKDQVSFTDDVGDADDDLLQRKIDAAQAHVERLLGFQIEATFGGEGQEPVPAPLVEAVAQLAAWWYLEREAATMDGRPGYMPFGVLEIVVEYREWTF